MTAGFPLLYAVLSGLLLSAAFPPAKLGYFAFVALIPLLFIMRSYSPGRVLLWSWIAGLVFHLITMFWLRIITWAGLFLAIPVLAFFFALPFFLARLVYMKNKTLGLSVLPFAVTAIEWLRSFDLLAFPWMILGNSQSSYPMFIQFSNITSVYGVSAWVVALNISAFLLIKRKNLIRWLFMFALLALPVAYSLYVLQWEDDSGGESIRVALVQGNVLPEDKWSDGGEFWNVNLYRTMSIEAMEYDPDLIVWPETATPLYMPQNPRYRRMVQSLADSINVPIVTGTPSIDFETGKTWNSAVLVEPGAKRLQKYDKIHLVPFGEAIPLDEYFPSLRRINFGQANWDRGTEPVVFESHHIPRFNTVICFESIFPDLVRRFVTKGSEFITVITNDVWFGANGSPQQHAMISVFRAIEFHRPIVRCANTGISMIIDANGRILHRSDTYVRTTVIGNIKPSEVQTFYMRYGNVFSMLSVLITAGMVMSALVTRIRITRDS